MRRAIAFLTPVGGAAAPSGAAVAWFPAVGALVGFAVGAVWWGADRIWPPAVAAAIAIAADLALTGLLHFDGLVDSADGLLPPLDRDRRLAVMSDPGAGAFGVGVAAATLLLRWTAFASLEPSAWLVAGLWCGSRTVMAVALRTIRPAKAGGLTAAFQGDGRRGGGTADDAAHGAGHDPGHGPEAAGPSPEAAGHGARDDPGHGAGGSPAGHGPEAAGHDPGHDAAHGAGHDPGHGPEAAGPSPEAAGHHAGPSPGRRPAGGGPVGAYGISVGAALGAGAIGLGPGLASVAALVVGAALVFLLAARRIGGVTGDVLGAAGVVGETVGLLVAAARW